jgi:ubiquinone/menaquinone biosynthesis C-methylase UbiE
MLKMASHVLSDTMTDITLYPSIERYNVIDSYDRIADTFSGTRYKAWPSTIKFIKHLKSGIRCLEVGSGNGKNMIRDDIDIIGIDVSEKLVEICRKNGKQVEVGDGCNIRFTDNAFDAVFSIAVLHHISSFERRRRFISEIIRVCKGEGEVMIEVWATSEPKFKTSKAVESVESVESVDTNDRMVSFFSRTDGKSYDRYYHFFTEEEFRELIDNTIISTDDGIKCLEGLIYGESDNWIFVGRVVLKNLISKS